MTNSELPQPKGGLRYLSREERAFEYLEAFIDGDEVKRDIVGHLLINILLEAIDLEDSAPEDNANPSAD